MPRGKSKQKASQKENEDVRRTNEQASQQQDPEGETSDSSYLNNENIDEYMPKPQVEWFSMVIKAQVKKHIPEYLEELKSKIEKGLEEKLVTLQEENKILKKECEEMKTELAACKSEIGKLKWSCSGIDRTLCKKTKELEGLKQTLDRIDQKQRETRVRITGIPEEDGEDLEKKITTLAKKSLGLKKMKQSDIEMTHRSGKKKEMKTRDIIVQFSNKTTRDNFQQEKKKLSSGGEMQKKIYINDDLTDFRLKGGWSLRLKICP